MDMVMDSKVKLDMDSDRNQFQFLNQESLEQRLEVIIQTLEALWSLNFLYDRIRKVFEFDFVAVCRFRGPSAYCARNSEL